FRSGVQRLGVVSAGGPGTQGGIVALVAVPAELHVHAGAVVHPASVPDRGDRVATVPGPAHAGLGAVDLLAQHPALLGILVGLEGAVAVPGVQRGGALGSAAGVDERHGLLADLPLVGERVHLLLGVVEVVAPQHTLAGLLIQHRTFAFHWQRLVPLLAVADVQGGHRRYRIGLDLHQVAALLRNHIGHMLLIAGVEGFAVLGGAG